MDIFDPLMGAALVALATSFGAALVFLVKKVDRVVYSALLAFAAGIMGFSVIEMLSESGSYSLGDAAFGFVFGVIAIMALEKTIPHMHGRIMDVWEGRGRGKGGRLGRGKGAGRGRVRCQEECCRMREGEMNKGERKAALLAGAVILHNVPEGLAVGFAFASSAPLGWLVAASIAIQDIPEGLLVSAPLACFGMKNKNALGFGVLSGVVEGLAAIFGFLFLSSLAPLVPIALSFSAGAMAYVVLVELLPDAFRRGLERVAGISLLCGFGLAFLIAKILVV